MLDIATDLADASREHLLFVGNTVVVRVRVEIGVVVVEFENHNSVHAQGHHVAGRGQPIHENSVAVARIVHAVIVQILMHGNPVDRLMNTRVGGILHIRPHFEDEQAAIAVESNLRRLRIPQNRGEAEPWWKREGRDLFLRSAY